jgi:hypothetical protein
MSIQAAGSRKAKRPARAGPAYRMLAVQSNFRADAHPMNPGPQDWPRVRELFEAALPLPSEERRGYILGACGADQALAGRVEELLNAHDRAQTFLETPVPASHLITTEQLAGKQIGPTASRSILARSGSRAWSTKFSGAICFCSSGRHTRASRNGWNGSGEPHYRRRGSRRCNSMPSRA